MPARRIAISAGEGAAFDDTKTEPLTCIAIGVVLIALLVRWVGWSWLGLLAGAGVFLGLALIGYGAWRLRR